MLELKNIQKDYPAGNDIVHALKGIDIKFRRNEFVSILGPSGCGKTTTLNIIGGLDQYTKGDLIINGKSTKDFKDRDWDTYRNHSVGFVFQSYNLIPHQSVLQNVELALTLSGVSKAERKKRAKQALADVGLGDQIHKKPSEMSGGQMQRVAIARALVNNPDIILADEPTGALDTETSVQVMEILKEISKDRLIVMVTHNPDLAEKYSTRIIRMLDGKITNDSAPLSEEEYQTELAQDRMEQERVGKQKKPSMSLTTSFSLSLKNLFSKKGRTALTSFAGSIGIIGIALVLAISQGFSSYIDTVQEETLSSYPLTIEKSETDLSTLMETFMGTASSDSEHENDAVYKKSAMYDMVEALTNLETTENDLKSFKTYIETERAKEDSTLHNAVSGVQYSYDLDLLIYTKNVDGTIIRSDTESLMQDLLLEYVGVDMTAMSDASSSILGTDLSSSMSSLSGMSSTLWQEMLPGDDGALISDVLENQYDVVYGSWPNSYDEVVLVLDENNELDDMTLYALGLESEEEVANLMNAAVNGDALDDSNQAENWSYEEICNMDFRTILNADCYSYDESTGLYVDLRKTDAGLQYLYDNGLTLKVTGIIRPKEDTTATILSSGIAYTSALTEYVIEQGQSSDAITAQLADSSTDILTGLLFQENTGNLTDAEKQAAFLEYLDNSTEAELADIYVQIMSIPDDEELSTSVEQAMDGLTRDDMEASIVQAYAQEMSMSDDEVQAYTESMSDEEIIEVYTQIVEATIEAQYAAQVQEQLSAMDTAELAAALVDAKSTYTTENCATYYDAIMVFFRINL